jgi:hypothetical protein
MHGKRFLLDSVYAGIDDVNVYGRLDFAEGIPDSSFELVVNLESWAAQGQRPPLSLRLDVTVQSAAIQSWTISQADEDQPLAASDQTQAAHEVKLVLRRNFEFKLPLVWLLAAPVASGDPQKSSAPVVTRVRLRFSLWQNELPTDALPLEGWIELPLLTENELAASAY